MVLTDKAVYAKCLNADRPITSGEAAQQPADDSSIDGGVKGAEATQP